MEETENLVDWKIKNKKKFVTKRVKYWLLFFSYLFWIIGAVFAAIGGWVISQTVRYESISDFATNPGAVIAALGCFIFIVSTFGVLGTLRENLCYLKTYKIFLITIFVFEFCAGLVGFAFWPEIKKVVDAKIRDSIMQYDDNERLQFMIDQVQRQFACCGSLTVDDWDSSPYYRCKKVGSYRSCGVPWSCCHIELQRNRQCGLKVRKNRLRKALSKTISTIGCMDKLFEYMRVNMFLIGGLAVACNLPLLLGIFLSARLMKQIKKANRAFNEANEKFHWFDDSRTITSPPFVSDIETTEYTDDAHY